MSEQPYQDKPNEEKSAAQIEREIDRTRAELDDTLDRIFNRLTPGELFEQTIDYIRSSHGFGRFGATVRDNPVPAVLAAFSIGWLVIAGLRTRTEQPARVGTPLPPPRYADRAALASAEREESVAGSGRVAPSNAEKTTTEQEQRSFASTTSRTIDAASEPAGRSATEQSG